MKKRIWKAVIFLILLIACNSILNFGLVDDVYLLNTVARCTKNTYEDMFLGTSQCRASVDPDTVAGITGRTTTNASAALSSPLDQYYFLQLYVRSGHKPERVIYEVDPYYFSEAKNGGHLLEFPAGVTQMEYLVASAKNDWRTVTSPWVFQWGNYFRFGEVVKDKVDFYRNGYDRNYHGFVRNHKGFAAADLMPDRAFKVTAQADQYLKKLAGYCRENGIELILMQEPVSTEVYENDEHEYRTTASAYFQSIADEYQLEYIDCNTENLGDFQNELSVSYIDNQGHMNGDSAEIFSQWMGERLSK